MEARDDCNWDQGCIEGRPGSGFRRQLRFDLVVQFGSLSRFNDIVGKQAPDINWSLTRDGLKPLSGFIRRRSLRWKRFCERAGKQKWRWVCVSK